jgi:site-specific DNA-methyltransferase (adenine-specific)
MIELLNIDCMEYMATLEDNAFDLAITDPPYGINMDNQKVRTKPNRPNTYKRANENQYKSSGRWDAATPNKEYFSELFRVSKHQIVWGANYFCDHLPPGKGWIFWDKLMGENNFSAGEFAYQSIQTRSAKFSEPSMRVEGTRIHPTQKPVKLYQWLFDNYSEPGQRILDTHLGSGSSAIAAHYYGVDFVGCELDQDYYDAASNRFNNETKQQAMF